MEIIRLFDVTACAIDSTDSAILLWQITPVLVAAGIIHADCSLIRKFAR